MDLTPEELARLSLEQQFGAHAAEVLHGGAVPPYATQLRLQEVTSSAPAAWRPELGDPDAYLQTVYHCQQQ
jgi:hypothetical protein